MKHAASRIQNRFWMLYVLTINFSCAIFPFYSYSNIQRKNSPHARIGQNHNAPRGDSIASLNVPWNVDLSCRNSSVWLDHPSECRKDDTNFIALSLSGGGSRSAVFSAAVMFELQNYRIQYYDGSVSAQSVLDSTDIITSASGGSLTAALFALSCNGKTDCPKTIENTKRIIWSPDTIYRRLGRSFQTRWFANLFWPDNMIRLFTTDFDRTDVMAETLSDNLFDTSFLGGEPFRFQDMNKQRPNIVINASDNTKNVNIKNRYFTFTHEDFEELESDIRDYPIGNAVAASSAYPGVLSYSTLRDFSENRNKFKHVFDAGTYDNLGLHSIQRIIENLSSANSSDERWEKSEKFVILVDSHTDGANRLSENTASMPSIIESILGLEFLNSFDSILASARYHGISSFEAMMKDRNIENLHLIDISFDSLLKIDNSRTLECSSIEKQGNYADERVKNLCMLYAKLNGIRTQFRVAKSDIECLRFAAKIIVNRELARYRLDGRHTTSNEAISISSPSNSQGSEMPGAFSFTGPSGTVYGKIKQEVNLVRPPAQPQNEIDPEQSGIGFVYNPKWKEHSSCRIANTVVTAHDLPEFARRGVYFAANYNMEF